MSNIKGFLTCWTNNSLILLDMKNFGMDGNQWHGELPDISNLEDNKCMHACLVITALLSQLVSNQGII